MINRDSVVTEPFEVEICEEDVLGLPKDWELVRGWHSAKEKTGRLKVQAGPLILEGDFGSNSFINTWTSVRREKRQGKRTGLRFLRALLRQQHLIPEALRSKWLFAMGAIARDPADKSCNIACLQWNENENKWELLWIEDESTFPWNYALRIVD